VQRARAGEVLVTPAATPQPRPAPLRGDVYWATFPAPVGRRPALVVQNDVGNRSSPSTIVAIVSTAPRPGYPFLVRLASAELGQAAVVHCETVSTVPIAWLEEKLATLSAPAMAAVDQALKVSLGLK
jgi:mRNA interferase MazF